MRILVVTAHQTMAGGVETYVQRMLPLLVTAGHDVAVLFELGAAHGAPTISDGAKLAGRWCVADLGLDACLDEIRRFAPDIVMQNGLRTAAIEERMLSEYRSVLFVHGHYGTCATGTRMNLRPTPQPCTRRFDAGCLVQNYVRGCGVRRPDVLADLYRTQRARLRMLPRYVAVLVASQYMRDSLIAHGVESARIVVVPMPVTEQATTHIERPASVATELLFAGRITELKGLQYLVRAVPIASAELGRTLSLTVAGDGPYRPAVHALAAKLGVRADFVGWVDEPECRELMRAADLLVVPSVWPEPFGMVGIEAAVVGLPTVAFDVGGIRTWLEPGESGELADGAPPRAEGLADAIVRALRSESHHAALRRGASLSATRFTGSLHISSLTSALEMAAESI
jgi:glycosyltransferase involved in cell wall biosynthesis